MIDSALLKRPLRPLPIAAMSLLLLGIFACQRDYPETRIDFSNYQWDEGLDLQDLAAEPLLDAPVALSFDDHGRLWVLEMPGYMPNLEGSNEEAPVGRISILEDRDADGIMDHRRVFLDSLRLARAFAHVYGGLLYAEPPRLLFTEIGNDLRPGRTTVVDSAYAIGGNVEHQPNGLLWNIDNWIYSAKGSKRYRLKAGVWETEDTSFRGQWGITHDRMGRLLYNVNWNQVWGDLAIPNLLNANPRFRPTQGIGRRIVEDQRVFPLIPTAVNRGYQEGVLDSTGRLRTFTSACGPLYFEGSALPEVYQGNVFVCGPEANLIKRNLLTYTQGPEYSGIQAYSDTEFVRSEDQAFRPVNLHNGPDGALYIADMHRGIIQHKTYMTSYLRELYLQRGLDTIRGMGRVLRMGQDLDQFRAVDLGRLGTRQWLDSLGSKNQWIRDRSQQLLIRYGDSSLADPLLQILSGAGSTAKRIHALYVLEALGLLRLDQENPVTYADAPPLLAHLIKLAAEQGVRFSPASLEQLAKLQDPGIDYYLSYYLARGLDTLRPAPEMDLLLALAERHVPGNIHREPLLSGIAGKEGWLKRRLGSSHGLFPVLDSISRIVPAQRQTIVYTDGLTRGRELFQMHCAACHGADGQGSQQLAPPLLGSEYVSGSPKGLAAVLLYGLSGPVHVNGRRYEFPVPMPGIGGNTQLSDEDIRDIGNFVRNAFAISPGSLNSQMVDSLRRSGRPFDQTLTEEEYLKYFEE